MRKESFARQVGRKLQLAVLELLTTKLIMSTVVVTHDGPNYLNPYTKFNSCNYNYHLGMRYPYTRERLFEQMYQFRS